MSLISENIIPGNYGKVFSTDAKEEKDLLKIKKAVEKLPGIKDVVLNKDIYPVELTIHTNALVHIDVVENEVKRFGFHAIPKGVFQL